MNQSEFQQLKEAINFLKKGYNDLASENTQLKIDLIDASKKFLEFEADYKQQTSIIFNQTVQIHKKIINKIDDLSLKIEKLENKQ
tara:strand:+ start:411 stop:665 length:255 start_codon:yes stop_codon:yes gene_type:complete